ncbi:MAG: ABC transporter ATP-binding protein [Pseudomonadota bacterium]
MVSQSPRDYAVRIQSMRFKWRNADADTLAINEFEISRGESVFLQGPSGSGKSTLLNIIAGVAEPYSGRVDVLGVDFTNVSPSQRDRLRADSIGVIFQLFNLVPYLSVRENALLSCRFSKARAARASAEDGDTGASAQRLLERLGLGERAILDKPARALSVGQQQRVAAARALLGKPGLVIADEPTSALDPKTRTTFLDVLFHETKASGAALLFISHDPTVAQNFDRQVSMETLNAAALNHDDQAFKARTA